MRVARWFSAIALIGGSLALATPARADGGAYISFDETYYVRGETAHAEGYVWIPERQREILDRGPFYAYLIPRSASYLTEGRPLPPGTIRVGTFNIEPFGKQEIELSVSFTIPDVATGSYIAQLCNDPCTVAGFREPQTGELTIAATTAEVELLRERDRLGGEIYAMKRKLRRAGNDAEDLQVALDAAVADRDAYALRIAELEAHASARITAPASPVAAIDAGRPLVDPWALVSLVGGALVVLLAIGLALVFSRRQRPILRIPDTIAELEPLARESVHR